MVSPFSHFCDMSVVPRAVFVLFCFAFFFFLQCSQLYVFIFPSVPGWTSQCYSTELFLKRDFTLETGG